MKGGKRSEKKDHERMTLCALQVRKSRPYTSPKMFAETILLSVMKRISENCSICLGQRFGRSSCYTMLHVKLGLCIFH